MSFKNNITRETLFNMTEYKILANLFNNISNYLIEKGQIKGELIYEINPLLSDIDYNYFVDAIKQLDIYYLPCSSVPTLNELTEIGKATNNSRFSTIKDSDENLFVMITPPNDINNLNIYNITASKKLHFSWSVTVYIHYNFITELLVNFCKFFC